jgi:putative hemolysin
MAAFFAAAEASLFSLSRTQLESLRESRPAAYRRIRNLIYRPEGLLSTLIISNEALNILIGTFTVALVESNIPLDERYVALISVLLSSVLLLTFSEILPKILAFRMPTYLAPFLVYPTSWAHSLVTPFRKIFLWISSQITRWIKIETQPQVVSEKDFLTLVEVGAETGSLDRDEKQMIFNVFSFSDLSVSAVMTPWRNVVSVPENFTVPEILNVVRKRTYSRIPVLAAQDNRVMGILYTKELLKLLLRPQESQEPNPLKNAVFPPYIVSIHKKVSKLFREFKQKKVHMALVVDEYGRHLGIVTLEDVLGALFHTQKKVEAVAR